MSDTKRRFAGLSPIAIAALAVGMLAVGSGGAVAGGLITGAQIKNNTITTADIKNNTVKSKDIKNGSVTGTDVKNGSVTGTDVKDGSLSTADLGDEPLLWGASNTSTINDLTTSNVVLVTKSISAPKGFLQVTADLYAEDDISLGGQGELSYRLFIDGKSMPTTQNRELLYPTSGDGSTGGTTVVVPIPAGAHTISLVGSEVGTGSFLQSANLSILWMKAASTNATIPARQVARSVNR